jgi:hypothetical protein
MILRERAGVVLTHYAVSFSKRIGFGGLSLGVEGKSIFVGH